MATSTRDQTYAKHQSDISSVGLLKRPFNSILNKIVLPFLLLTLLVAVSGTFIVTRVLAANVQDRLTNQLIDTARAASDRIVLAEQQQLDALRLAVFTRGVPDALRDGDEATLDRTMVALAGNQDLFTLIATDIEGNVVAGVRRDNGSYITGWLVGQNLTITPIIQAVTGQEQDELGDKFAGILIIDEQIVLLTVAPVYDQSGTFVGTMSVGVPLPEVLSSTKQEVLADITFYQSDGSPLETTFILPEMESVGGQNGSDDVPKRPERSCDITRTVSENCISLQRSDRIRRDRCERSYVPNSLHSIARAPERSGRVGGIAAVYYCDNSDHHQS